MFYRRSKTALTLWTTIAALALALTAFVSWPAHPNPVAGDPIALPAPRADYSADPGTLRGLRIVPVAPAAIGDTLRDRAAQQPIKRATTRR